MLEFSVDKYTFSIYIGEEPTLYDYFNKNAVHIDVDDLKLDGTAIYIITAEDYSQPKYSIIAFRTEPIAYGGFKPALLYEQQTQTLFIGAGSILKTVNLLNHKIVFQKNWSFGFWGWAKHGDYIIQQEELALGIFSLEGRQLWEMQVGPPYDFSIHHNRLTAVFDGKTEVRELETGLLLDA